MAKGDPVADEEVLVRALYPPHYDENRNKVNSSAFRDLENSVSRLQVLPMDEISSIFKADLKRYTGRVCTLSAGAVRAIVTAAESVSIEVEIVEDQLKDDPISVDNPAHALIKPFDKAVFDKVGVQVTPRKARSFTEGVSKKLLRQSTAWNCASAPATECEIIGVGPPKLA